MEEQVIENSKVILKLINLIKYQASHNVIVMPGKEGFPNFVELGMSERRGD